ncbi:MAG: class II fructose-bisphosphate aldolase [Eubacteriales bacterium]|nr:class II fructose-bisphosphate aldolase [Eubacteriales bacterium]
MLANLNELMRYAEEKQVAIGAFNGPTLESARAALEAAEQLNMPVILQHAPAHDPYISLELAGRIMLTLADQAAVPVCVHLDHGDSAETVMRAIRTGYTSVMYDASGKPFEQNLEETRSIVSLAHAVGVSVEAELGNMPHNFHNELTEYDPEAFYTVPEDAKKFADATGVDALAISFGTVHGVYKAKPRLNFDIIRQVRAITNGLPLVMHGGSGLSDEDYRTAIACGIRKVNYYTYQALAGGRGIYQAVADHPQNLYFHDAAMAATKAMREDVLHILGTFSGGER